MVLPVAKHCAHGHRLVLVVQLNVDGGALPGGEHEIIELGGVGAGYCFGRRTQRVGVGNHEAHLEIASACRGGHRERIECELAILVHILSGRIEAASLEIFGYAPLDRLSLVAHPIPAIFHRLVENRQAPHARLVVLGGCAGREAVDAHSHLHIAQGVAKLHQGDGAARLGMHVGAVVEHKVLLAEFYRAAVGGVDSPGGVDARERNAVGGVLFRPDCAVIFAVGAQLPVKFACTQLVGGAVGDESVAVEGVAPIDSLRRAVIFQARPTSRCAEPLYVRVGEHIDGIDCAAYLGEDDSVAVGKVFATDILLIFEAHIGASFVGVAEGGDDAGYRGFIADFLLRSVVGASGEQCDERYGG